MSSTDRYSENVSTDPGFVTKQGVFPDLNYNQQSRNKGLIVISVKFGQLSLVIFSVCMNCATGQDEESSRLRRTSNGPSPRNVISNESKPVNSVDDYLRSLPSMTADGKRSLDVSGSNLIPKQLEVSRVDLASSGESPKPLTWMSPNICYRKSYFNDDRLERHGRTHGFFQPAYSISRLLIQTSVYPVQRTLNLGQSIECVEVNRFSSTELD